VLENNQTIKLQPSTKVIVGLIIIQFSSLVCCINEPNGQLHMITNNDDDDNNKIKKTILRPVTVLPAIDNSLLGLFVLGVL
jgi:hypothetical protein